jgi:GT2 family glycosyltransferase
MSILAVMVRYNTPLAQSDTANGVREALALNPILREKYRFLIWDNSPEGLTNPNIPTPFEYHHSRHNLGISGACNDALQLAHKQGHAWILLLDQDTHVTAAFLETMLRWSMDLALRREIAIAAPTVRVGNKIVSPRRHLFNRHHAYPDAAPCIAEGEPFAINSGSLMRTSALRAVGGFSPDFWLDYSDIYVCHQLYLHGYKIWRATDAELQHEMSVMDYDRLMTPSRYTNFSYAETAFNDLYKGRLENWVQNLRLAARAVRQRRRYQDPAFSRITLAQLIYRLRVSRASRIEQWKQSGEQRRARATLQDALDQRIAG